MVLITGDMHGQTMRITDAIRRFDLKADGRVIFP